jgi:hypothetical protein
MERTGVRRDLINETREEGDDDDCDADKLGSLDFLVSTVKDDND